MGKLLQLRISLDGIEPEIWRTFQVDDTISFELLHCVIQDIMGWSNYHMYEFLIEGETITCDEEGFNLAEASFRKLEKNPEFLKLVKRQVQKKHSTSLDVGKINEILHNPSKDKTGSNLTMESKVCELINVEGQRFSYMYDFGDNWLHSLAVERISDDNGSVHAPVCTGGSRACPPEDCGGLSGYEHLMKVRLDKKHPEYKELIKGWLGEGYDPEYFDAGHMNKLITDGKDLEEEYIPLSELLEDDCPKIKEITTLLNREEEYKNYIGEVESAIAEFFLENPKLKDKDVESFLNNIKQNYLQDLDFFQEDLEKKIVLRLSYAIQEEPITHHELKLVLNYVLWSLDNRSWIPDRQAFVKWLPYFFGMYDKKQAKEYETNMRKVARRLGIPSDKVNMMLMKDDASITAEEMEASKSESEFFALDDDEKLEYVVRNYYEAPSIVRQFVEKLEEKKDYATIETLFKSMMQKTGNFPLFEFMLGLNYNSKGDDKLARHHMQNAVRNLENAPAGLIIGEDREKILQLMRKHVK
ncbi:MAG: plasmid pRiA4b ORF-3 family protein [Candidatus Woesearchaeota archaeon]